MITGLKLTLSVEPQDTAAMATAILNAPHGVKIFAIKKFTKHTRFIIRFRNIQQLTGLLNKFGKECTGKYLFLKKPRKERLRKKIYLIKPKPAIADIITEKPITANADNATGNINYPISPVDLGIAK